MYNSVKFNNRRKADVSNYIGDYLVPLFFVSGAGALWFLAYKFISAKKSEFRNFGTGLALYGLAFAVWGLVVLNKPADLGPLTTLGAVPFLFAHLFFLLAVTNKMKASNKSTVLAGGLAYLVALFALRTFVYPSAPSFSTKGLFYFHAQPVIIALYVVAFAASLLPAINTVSRLIKDKQLRFISQTGFTAAAIGGIILVTSYDDNLQTINGYIMGLTYISLVVAFARKKIA